jgi:hypothetical protein
MFVQHRFAHCVKRVLYGKTVVFGECLQDRFPDVVPHVLFDDRRAFIFPNSFYRCRKYPIGRFRQRGVLVFDIANET